jgi:predicted transcriptional regulator
MKQHLAIFSQSLADEVLTGKKTVDFRFSKTKNLPYLKVTKDDVVLLKNSGQDVCGRAEVDNVLYFDDLNQNKLLSIELKYLKSAAISKKQFCDFARGAKYLSIIFLKNPNRFVAPYKIHKKDQRSWVVLA